MSISFSGFRGHYYDFLQKNPLSELQQKKILIWLTINAAVYEIKPLKAKK